MEVRGLHIASMYDIMQNPLKLSRNRTHSKTQRTKENRGVGPLKKSVPK
jgi:hypothetical protein